MPVKGYYGLIRDSAGGGLVGVSFWSGVIGGWGYVVCGAMQTLFVISECCYSTFVLRWGTMYNRQCGQGLMEGMRVTTVVGPQSDRSAEGLATLFRTVV